eukprot:4757035-Lingulodinium_polyedra.AAC.1
MQCRMCDFEATELGELQQHVCRHLPALGRSGGGPVAASGHGAGAAGLPKEARRARGGSCLQGGKAAGRGKSRRRRKQGGDAEVLGAHACAAGAGQQRRTAGDLGLLVCDILDAMRGEGGRE